MTSSPLTFSTAAVPSGWSLAMMLPFSPQTGISSPVKKRQMSRTGTDRIHGMVSRVMNSAAKFGEWYDVNGAFRHGVLI
ncbi:MAG: hypothetical protein IJQ73_03085 [Kiritimatiellae bacterium]|nr:hypothetical protein [Kiritimatiellia bacterium]